MEFETSLVTPTTLQTMCTVGNEDLRCMLFNQMFKCTHGTYCWLNLLMKFKRGSRIVFLSSFEELESRFISPLCDLSIQDLLQIFVEVNFNGHKVSETYTD